MISHPLTTEFGDCPHCVALNELPLICRQLWQYIWLAKRIELKKKILIYLWNFQANSISYYLMKGLLHCRLINLKFIHRLYISIQLALAIHCFSQTLTDFTEKNPCTLHYISLFFHFNIFHYVLQ